MVALNYSNPVCAAVVFEMLFLVLGKECAGMSVLFLRVFLRVLSSNDLGPRFQFIGILFAIGLS